MDSKEKFIKKIDLERRLCEIRIAASNESDMLTGNKNRMFVCDDTEELEKHLTVAKKRIEVIYELNRQRLEIESELSALDKQ